MMKKPHYPLWLQGAVELIVLMYIAFMFGGVSIALTIGLLSALFILREKESLYIAMLISFMILFFDTLLWVSAGGSIIREQFVAIFSLIVHLVVLFKLSQMCFGAVWGGGNYKKKKAPKKKK